LCKEFCKKLRKKIILGTSDAWLMSRLSQRATEPAYYIVDCRIFELDLKTSFWQVLWQIEFYRLTFLQYVMYRTHAIISRSRFEAILVYKPWILSFKKESRNNGRSAA
jgi:hypothetical protein